MSRRPHDQEMSGTLLDAVRNVGREMGALSATAGLLGLLSVGVALTLFMAVPGSRMFGYILLGLGAALLVTALVVARRQVAETVTGRQGRYGANTILMILAFLGIVVILNFFVYDNPARLDVTSTRQFSLAPRTVEILKNLEQQVEAVAFFDRNDLTQQPSLEVVDNMLHEFDVRSDLLSYRIVNLDVEPATARDYGVNQHGQVAFANKDTGVSEVTFGSYFVAGNPVAGEEDQYFANPAMEQDFVTPLLVITGQGEKSVFSLVGHGERNITSQLEDDGYFLAGASLAAEGYEVRPLDLQTQSIAPRQTGEGEGQEVDDSQVSPSLVLIAGPTKDLLPGEAEALTQYLRDGGRMLMLLDPETPDSFREFLAAWGLKLGRGNIVDQEDFIGEERTPFISQHNPSNAVTSTLGRTFFPGVTSLDPSFDETPTFELNGEAIPLFPAFNPLALTSDSSWMIEEEGRSEPDEDSDERGPFFPAVEVGAYGPIGSDFTDPDQINSSQYVVIGDSDFATNEHFNSASNGDLFLNSANYLIGDVSLINIRPKLVPRRELLATPREFNIIRYTSWFLLPALMGAMGVFVWWRRR